MEAVGKLKDSNTTKISAEQVRVSLSTDSERELLAKPGKHPLAGVRHDYLRYANCWEDADVLLKAFSTIQNGRFLSIASAGDNSFSLLCLDPKEVVAVDINPVQIALVELKKAAFKTLDYDDFLVFLGFKDGLGRLELYKQVSLELDAETKAYWSSNQELIESGVIHGGKFERYFKLFRSRVLPLVHSRRTVNRLFQVSTQEEAEVFYHQKWNNWRFRALFRFFFGKWMMGRLGRDPAFLKQVDQDVPAFLMERARRCFTGKGVANNYFLDYALRGAFDVGLPHYARKENFNTIKSRVGRLKTQLGLADEIAQKYGPFDGFNLSNIFEYLPENDVNVIAEKLQKSACHNVILVYWNLMVSRDLTMCSSSITRINKEGLKNLQETDKGFFYGALHVNEIGG